MPEDGPETTVACTLSADEARERTENVRDDLATAYSGSEETEDGISVQFEGTEETLRTVAIFVSNELQCCSFAEFTMKVSPPFETTQLQITGPDGTAQLFRDGLVSTLDTDSG
jgi:hypothetical protein